MLIPILILIGILLFFLPKIIQMLGVHPHYEGKNYDLPNKKALIITTSQAFLGNEKNAKPTGVYASEMTVPYYEFLDANMQVDLASIKGGKIPIEKMSIIWPLATESDKRFLKDTDALAKANNSAKIDDIDFLEYDIIYFAGGWGAAYDLGYSEILGEKLTESYANGVILGSVCHGALGFLKAKDTDGKPLVQGKHITAVTDKQIKQLMVSQTPLHPETELKKAGAIFECKTSLLDLFADLTVVDDRIVTGQNQNAGKETAQNLLKLLEEKVSKAA